MSQKFTLINNWKEFATYWICLCITHVPQTGLTTEAPKGSQASWWKQLSTLTRRSFVNMSRDIGYYWLRIIIYIVVSICVGTIYFDVGTGHTAILARGACGGFISGFMTFMSIGGFPSFIEEMKVSRTWKNWETEFWNWACFLRCSLNAGVPSGEAQWALWSCSLYPIELPLLISIPGSSNNCIRNYNLADGEIPARIFSLSVLLPQSFREHFSGWELYDGGSFSSSQLFDGARDRGWNHCKNQLFQNYFDFVRSL